MTVYWPCPLREGIRESVPWIGRPAICLRQDPTIGDLTARLRGSTTFRREVACEFDWAYCKEGASEHFQVEDGGTRSTLARIKLE